MTPSGLYKKRGLKINVVLVLLQKTGKKKRGARDENNQNQVSKIILGLVTKTILVRVNNHPN
jgi:uncharacterized protein YwbE